MNLIIKIDDDIAKGIRGENECEVEPREIVRSFQATIADAIKNGTPVSTDGDLISREALKATILEPLNVNDAGKNDWYEGYYTAKNEDVASIDNAPTVDIKTEVSKELAKEAREIADESYKYGYEKGKADARPKGEWIKVKEEVMSVDIVTLYKCSECERVIATLPSKLAKYYPFCHCGADMRKGGAE